MTSLIQAETPPLREDTSGALRVGSSRVLLEVVIHAFNDGQSPEEIVAGFPTTTLADVYAVIAYYLRHREEIERYLAERDRIADEVKQRIEERQGDLTEVRQRLSGERGN